MARPSRPALALYVATLLVAGSLLPVMASADVAPTLSNALAASMRFYHVQRSGAAPPLPSWRGDCYTSDGSGVGIDLSGGWFDAGDHVKFMLPMSFSATALAWGGLSFPQSYISSRQDVELVSHLRFVTEFFLKAWDSDNQRLVGQVGDGNLDHSFWTSCEVNTESRPVFFLTPDCPGTEVAAEMSAALSASAMALTELDPASDTPAYAAQLLAAARQLYDFADTYRGKYSDCITNARSFYNSWSGYGDELAWGAAWLYKATGEAHYLATAEQRYAELNRGYFGWTLAWDDKSYGAALLLLEETGNPLYEQHVRNNLDHWLSSVPTTPGGLKVLDSWGSLRYAANSAFLALKLSAYTGDTSGAYAQFAASQMDYIMGNNPAGRTYVSGLGVLYPVNPHHRTASGTWGNSVACCPEENRHILYGALVGGPSNAQSDDSYNDVRDDYVSNEVATDYNALFTGAAAGMLQLLRGGAETPDEFPEEQPSPEDEFSLIATVNSQGTSYTEFKVLLQQRTAWPARRVPLSYRYYADFSDVIAQQLDPLTAVTLRTAYMEFDPTVSGLTHHNGPVYFFEVSWSAENAPYPGGRGVYEAETQVRMSLSSGGAWDRSSDPSYSALQGASTIPIFEDGVLSFGSVPSTGPTTPSPPTTQPAPTTPAPPTTAPAPTTAAPTPSPTPAPTPAPTTAPPAIGYCNWNGCNGVVEGGPWCNQDSSFCGQCGGTWCPPAGTPAPTTASPTPATLAPTPSPTPTPTTAAPTPAPTEAPSPTPAPTPSPTTAAPTPFPATLAPTPSPTPSPTTATPTPAPTTPAPTPTPTPSPTTAAPTTSAPTPAPSPAPTTAAPTPAPTPSPTTAAPTTLAPTSAPSPAPTPATPTGGYCNWAGCNGEVQGGTWCNQDDTFCGRCGGQWCSGAEELPPGCTTAVAWWGQCGGGASDWSSHCCRTGSTCVYGNEYYSQCRPSSRKMML
mmetsp:Transcript_12662/g.31956  ORF Transcript_12662/g.31956 Transcript_12662/m.31956 type:complete len:962 (+) Transcript_12662:38-2923(+)